MLVSMVNTRNLKRVTSVLLGPGQVKKNLSELYCKTFTFLLVCKNMP